MFSRVEDEKSFITSGPDVDKLLYSTEVSIVTSWVFLALKELSLGKVRESVHDQSGCQAHTMSSVFICFVCLIYCFTFTINS